MNGRGTCTKCGRAMQVRVDGLIRAHRDLADNRCLGGGQRPRYTGPTAADMETAWTLLHSWTTDAARAEAIAHHLAALRLPALADEKAAS